jgi:hypothetical protein
VSSKSVHPFFTKLMQLVTALLSSAVGTVEFNILVCFTSSLQMYQPLFYMSCGLVVLLLNYLSAVSYFYLGGFFFFMCAVFFVFI